VEKTVAKRGLVMNLHGLLRMERRVADQMLSRLRASAVLALKEWGCLQKREREMSLWHY
jgi:hypothetical protein